MFGIVLFDGKNVLDCLDFKSIFTMPGDLHGFQIVQHAHTHTYFNLPNFLHLFDISFRHINSNNYNTHESFHGSFNESYNDENVVHIFTFEFILHWAAIGYFKFQINIASMSFNIMKTRLFEQTSTNGKIRRRFTKELHLMGAICKNNLGKFKQEN